MTQSQSQYRHSTGTSQSQHSHSAVTITPAAHSAHSHSTQRARSEHTHLGPGVVSKVPTDGNGMKHCGTEGCGIATRLSHTIGFIAKQHAPITDAKIPKKEQNEGQGGRGCTRNRSEI